MAHLTVEEAARGKGDVRKESGFLFGGKIVIVGLTAV